MLEGHQTRRTQNITANYIKKPPNFSSMVKQLIETHPSKDNDKSPPSN